MTAVEFLKRVVVPGVVGVASAVLVTLLEPFKSNFPLAVLAGAGVGVICAMIEVAIRSVTKKLNRTTPSPRGGSGAGGK